MPLGQRKSVTYTRCPFLVSASNESSFFRHPYSGLEVAGQAHWSDLLLSFPLVEYATTLMAPFRKSIW